MFTQKSNKRITPLLVAITCLIFAMTHQVAFSQSETVKKIKIGVSISSFYSSLIGAYISPAVIIQKGEHSFSVGPKVFVNNTGNKTLTLPKPQTTADKIGIQGNYKFYPNLSQNRLDFYFQYQIHYTSFHSLLTGYEYNDNGEVKNKKYKVIENKIGYGLNFKLFEKLYVNQSIVYGLDFMKIRVGNTNYADEFYGSFTVAFGLNFYFD